MPQSDPQIIQKSIIRLLCNAPEPVGFEFVSDRIHRYLIFRDEDACRDLIVFSRAFIALLKIPEFTDRMRNFYDCTADSELLTKITKQCFTDYAATRAGDPITDAQNAQTVISLPLGVQKAYARQHQRNHHEALFHTPWPQVVEILVENPSLYERDILRMASRKPTQNCLLEPILASAWSSRQEVRFALAANPCLSVSHAMRCALSLSVPSLQHISEMPELHCMIRDFARSLLDYRKA